MESVEYLGQFTLRQSDTCFKLGRDSIQLSRFTTVKAGWRVCDLGCGVGSLLLLLSQREKQLERYGIEYNATAAELARRNLEENQLSGSILTADLREKDLIAPDSMQLVISNPPYFRNGSGKSGGTARMDETCSVEELCTVAGRLLRSGGRFAVVYRPERMAELFCAMTAARMAPKRMQLLSYQQGRSPYAVLTEAVKDGGAGLSVLPTHYQEG